MAGELSCFFCKKDQGSVKALIKRFSGYVCDECINEAIQIYNLFMPIELSYDFDTMTVIRTCGLVQVPVESEACRELLRHIETYIPHSRRILSQPAPPPIRDITVIATEVIRRMNQSIALMKRLNEDTLRLTEEIIAFRKGLEEKQ